MTTVAATVQAFFTERLISERRASPHTIAAYRMLLTFAAGRAAKPLSHLDFADLNASAVAAFLDHLEHDRGNSIRSRKARTGTADGPPRCAQLGGGRPTR